MVRAWNPPVSRDFPPSGEINRKGILIVLAGMLVLSVASVGRIGEANAPSDGQSSGSAIPRTALGTPAGDNSGELRGPTSFPPNLPNPARSDPQSSGGTTWPGQVVATIGGLGSPQWIGVDPVSGYAYVSDTFNGTVNVIDGTVIVANITTGGNPEGVTYDPADGTIYVALDGTDAVGVIRGTTLLGTFPVLHRPNAILYDSEDGFVYVANRTGSTVDLINGTTVVRTVALWNSSDTIVPYSGIAGMTFDPTSGNVYVTETRGASDLQGLGVLRAGRNVGNVTLGYGLFPSDAAYNSEDGHVYCTIDSPSGPYLAIIENLSVISRITNRLDPNPWDLTFNQLNSLVYITNQEVGQTGNLTVIDSQGAIGNLPLGSLCGGQCFGMAVDTVHSTLLIAASSSVIVVSGWAASTGVVQTPAGNPPNSADVGESILFNTTFRYVVGSFTANYSTVPNTGLGCSPSIATTANQSQVELQLACVPILPGWYLVTLGISTARDENYSSSLLVEVYDVPIVSSPVAINATGRNTASFDVGQQMTIIATAIGGTQNFTAYEWTGLPPECGTGAESRITCSASTAGSYSIAVSAVDSNGIRSETAPSFGLTIYNLPEAGSPVINRTSADVGQFVRYTETAAQPGSGGLRYDWIGLPRSCMNARTGSPTCYLDGPQTVLASVALSDSNGGSSARLVAPPLEVYPDPSVETLVLSPDQVDTDQSFSVSAITTNGSGNLTFAWAGLPADCAGSGPVVTCRTVNSGSYYVSLGIEDSNGMKAVSLPAILTVVPARPSLLAEVLVIAGVAIPASIIAAYWFRRRRRDMTSDSDGVLEGPF